ncbi:Mbeg1-like protein [Paenibacillus rhizophilus]|nr:Mbeg1-like protein [Paenibacillus rhizophilus]
MVKELYRNDWKNNGTTAYAIESVQQAEVRKYIENLKLEEGQKLYLTGHSSSGNLAMYSSFILPDSMRKQLVSASTFNAPGFNGRVLDKYKHTIEELNENGQIKEFRNKHDLVPALFMIPSDGIYIDTTSKEYTGFSHHSMFSLKAADNQEQFQPTDADTKDHQDLVDAVMDSFRYETDLVYINNKKISVNLRNEPLNRQGNTIVSKPAVLSVNDDKGVNAVPLLTVVDRGADDSRYKKKVEEIYHSQDKDNTDSTHPYWKNILEGYTQSSTLGSFDNYKYREFVKTGQHMYKITEKTTVSIIVNKDNVPLYTDARMSDGKYYVKAWIADVELEDSSNAYNKLGKLVGVKPLDEIEVTVKGSMYDDLNN